MVTYVARQISQSSCIPLIHPQKTHHSDQHIQHHGRCYGINILCHIKTLQTAAAQHLVARLDVQVQPGQTSLKRVIRVDYLLIFQLQSFTLQTLAKCKVCKMDQMSTNSKVVARSVVFKTVSKILQGHVFTQSTQELQAEVQELLRTLDNLESLIRDSSFQGRTHSARIMKHVWKPIQRVVEDTHTVTLALEKNLQVVNPSSKFPPSSWMAKAFAIGAKGGR